MHSCYNRYNAQGRGQGAGARGQDMSGMKRLEQIRAMLAEEPSDPELRYMLAMEHVSQGDDEEAVRCFEELIRLAPNYPPAYHQGGRTLQRLNRLTDARSLLQRGIPIAQAQGNDHAAGEMMELLQGLET
jgi:Flp pilus assembly protein TadD